MTLSGCYGCFPSYTYSCSVTKVKSNTVRSKNSVPAYLSIHSCASPLVFDEGRAIRRVVTATVLPVILFIDTPFFPSTRRTQPDRCHLGHVSPGGQERCYGGSHINLLSTQITGRRARRHSTSGNFEWVTTAILSKRGLGRLRDMKTAIRTAVQLEHGIQGALQRICSSWREYCTGN